MSVGFNCLFEVKYIYKLFSSIEVYMYKMRQRSRGGVKTGQMAIINAYIPACKSRNLLQGS